MESNFNKENLIDDLITGRISDVEADKALQQIQSDPTLSSDFEFQKDLTDQLKEVRKAELKMRLDALPIEPVLIGGLTASALLKWGGSAITATLIGVSGYLLLSGNDGLQNSLEFVPSKIETIDLSSTSVAQGPDEIQRFDLKGIQSLPITASTNSEPLISEENTDSESKILAPEVITPSVTELFEEEIITTPELDSNPDLSINLSEGATEIENVVEGKYPFHYKYYNSKLYLYGDFKGVPYDILEVHGKSGRVTYLSYEGKFYQLKNPVKGVKPLVPIGDKSLIEELEILKEEKAF